MNNINHIAKTGYLFALLGGTILSFDTVLIRAINFTPEQIAFWRSFSMSLPMIIIIFFSLLKRKNKSKKTQKYGKDFFLASFFYGLSAILFPVSAMTTSIANMLFIISTAPLWAAILSWFVTKEVVNRMTILAFVISIAGVTIVMSGSSADFSVSFGDISALLTAMSMAAAFVVGRVSKQDLSLTPSIGAIFSFILLYLYFDINFDISLFNFFLILIEGSVIVFLALTLIAKSSKLIPSSHLGFFLLLETVFGPIWIWLVFGDRPNIYTLIGGGIILTALIANSIHSIRILQSEIAKK
ncbi:EamA-like transporter family protein [Xenorhabdus cabanillasii]|uniref:EamA-like transporter family protein n=1 Tax=Xenorhabdus cabanillasii TaxID=351673 RepID=A0A3D9UKJ0_9GAMM|nr:DMT family transporter [Xenorhabdus cabanillasii]REF26514.1 EamA-like transporter family protein [Xenorhabdus cabanillasii]